MSQARHFTLLADLLASGEASLQTGPFGTQLSAGEYVQTGVPVINVRNIGFGTLRADKLEFITESTRDRLSGHVLQAGDIVFGRKGAVERHVLIRKGQEGWFQGSDCIRLRLFSERLKSEFVSYFLLTAEHQQWMLNQCSHGATMASLNQAILGRIALPLPPVNVQRRIAAILSAYDDLIETCERRIRVLDEMARALYREWFVNFRYPGHEKVPLVEPGSARIPKGWTQVTLRAVAKVNTEQVDVKKAPPRIRYIDISSVSPGTVENITDYRFADAPGRARRVVHDGDILWSTVRPNRRSYALVLDPEDATIASTGFAVLTATEVPFTYLYAATTTDEFVGYIERRATGAAYPAVTARVFEEAPLVIPPASVLEHFARASVPSARLTALLQRKIMNLRKTRDLLLPRLLSGQLAVSAAT